MARSVALLSVSKCSTTGTTVLVFHYGWRQEEKAMKFIQLIHSFNPLRIIPLKVAASTSSAQSEGDVSAASHARSQMCQFGSTILFVGIQASSHRDGILSDVCIMMPSASELANGDANAIDVRFESVGNVTEKA